MDWGSHFQSKSIWDRKTRDEIGKSSKGEIYWHSGTTGKLPALQTTWMIYGVILTARKTVVLLKKQVDRVWPMQPIYIETDLVEMCKSLASSFTWLAGRGKIQEYDALGWTTPPPRIGKLILSMDKSSESNSYHSIKDQPECMGQPQPPFHKRWLPPTVRRQKMPSKCKLCSSTPMHAWTHSCMLVRIDQF